MDWVRLLWKNMFVQSNLVPSCSSKRWSISNVNGALKSLPSKGLFADIAYKHAQSF